MTRHEKLITIANALAARFGVEPDFDPDDEPEIHAFIKSVLNKTNANLKKCPYCNSVMARKYSNGKLRYACKNCNKIFALKEV